MDKISRDYLKRLVAEHRLDDLIEELFQLLINYLSLKEDKNVSEIYDSLTLISGKLKNIRRQNIINIIDSKDLALEYSKISHSLIFIINEIPDSIFIKKEKESNAQQNLQETDFKDIIRTMVRKEIGYADLKTY